MAKAADETTPGGAGKKLRTENSNSNGIILSSDEQMLKRETATITTFPHRYFHSTTIENLPEEILSNIFIRLLAKQLAQMRSVSKSWNALLSEPSFIKSHLHRSIHNNDQFLLVFPDEGNSLYESEQFTLKLCQSPNLELISYIKLPVNPQFEYTSGIKVIGSVNGLICSSFNNDSVIQIWNPSLSAVITLPPYSTPSHDIYGSIKIHILFGYDPKTDDYKVVKLTGLTKPPTYAVKWWLQIEIYSMRKGSWELITERFPSCITNIINGDYVCVDGNDGHLHWLCCIGEKMDSQMIVAFGLGSETFHEIPPPHSILDLNRDNILGVLAGKLCVVSRDRDGTCEVWVMEEYGVPESWVKRHVLSLASYVSGVLGFMSHDKFLYVCYNSFVLYDLTRSANMRKILENHCLKDYDVHHIVEYVDSLVWVAPAKHEMVDDGGQS